MRAYTFQIPHLRHHAEGDEARLVAEAVRVLDAGGVVSGGRPGPRYVGTRSPYLNSCADAFVVDAPRSLYPGGSWLLMLSLADAAAAFSAAPIFSCEALRLL